MAHPAGHPGVQNLTASAKVMRVAALAFWAAAAAMVIGLLVTPGDYAEWLAGGMFFAALGVAAAISRRNALRVRKRLLERLAAEANES